MQVPMAFVGILLMPLSLFGITVFFPLENSTAAENWSSLGDLYCEVRWFESGLGVTSFCRIRGVL